MSGQTPTHRRRRGTEAWEAIDPTPTADNEYRICVVRQNQPPGQPLHWSLFVYQEGVPGGMMLQVTGDAVHMHYQHAQNVDLFNSSTFRDQFDLGTATEAQCSQIWSAAHMIVPPQANSQAEVVENCQGWTIRLVQWLVQQGMVSADWIGSLRDLTESL
ncbi:MAG: hypothetical protein M1825_004345 [Sarcosagium campestre]|nr:MAG: hypothetical protein M1825_004345 [Sarcosagium campestre]